MLTCKAKSVKVRCNIAIKNMRIRKVKMAWTPMLSFHVKSPIVSNATEHGCIETIEQISSYITVRMLSNASIQRIYNPFVVKIPHLCECVLLCKSFRIECSVSDGRIVRLILCVDNCEFLDEVTHLVAGEASVIGLVSAVCRESYIPNASVPIHNANDVTRQYSTDTQRWNSDMVLFSHQNASLNWLTQIEQSIHAEGCLQYSKRIAIGETHWYIDVELELLTKDPKLRSRRFRGGLLCNGIGTGKTAIALCLSLHQPINKMSNISESFTHIAKGTLVIVPINLPSQWLQESLKFYQKGAVNVIQLVRGRDLKNLTMSDLLSADVVITTLPFLRVSRPYNEMVDCALYATYNQNVKKNRNTLMTWARLHRDEPIVEAVYWPRVIVDEIHDVFESPKDMRVLNQLNFHICWGLTATPDLTECSLSKLYFFLEKESQHEPHLLDQFIQTATRGAPAMNEPHSMSLRLTKLSARERILLQSYENNTSIEDTIRLCSQIQGFDINDHTPMTQIGDTTTIQRNLTEALHVNIADAQNELRCWIDCIVGIQNCQDSCDVVALLCDTYFARTKTSEALTDIKTLSDLDVEVARSFAIQTANFQKQRIEREINAETQKLSFFTERIALLERNNDVCSLCLDRRCSVITKCGHLYCRPCIHRALQYNLHCPECRANIQATDLHSVVLDGMGSKICALSKLVQTLNEPVIIFSHWKTILKHIKAMLRSMDVRVFTLDGNTNQRANSLRSFASVGGALLLSLGESFAGLHLPCARHVIFSHAVIGSPERVKSVEEQAIGRALRPGQTKEVYVYSFIVADSVEETIWRSTHS